MKVGVDVLDKIPEQLLERGDMRSPFMNGAVQSNGYTSADRGVGEFVCYVQALTRKTKCNLWPLVPVVSIVAPGACADACACEFSSVYDQRIQCEPLRQRIVAATTFGN